MAGNLNVSGPPPFSTDIDPSRLSTAWTKWLGAFDIYITATGVTDANQKTALLLHCGGDGIQTIHSTLTIAAATNEVDVFKQTKTALTAHFAPQKNKRYERHLFRLSAQNESETMNQWVTKLRT
jgi:bisphosphoglycerate-dependent phosphoglycerate mutase